jgi:Circularly permuted ATP-grasp type 2
MTAYDELHDETGAMRAPYATILARSGIDVTNPAVPALRSPESVGDRSIYPVPLVLNEDEYRSTIVPGVLQRAFLLQALFEDIAIGSAKLLNSGLLSEDELEGILLSEGIDLKRLRHLWQGQSPDQIRFVYGPDLVRNPEGKWVVLEDNVGCVGGVAQGAVTRDAYLQSRGLSSPLTFPSHSDLERAVQAFFDRTGVKPHTNGLFGFAGWSSPNGLEVNDFETRVKADCLRSFGITVTQPDELLAWMRKGAANPSAIVNFSATMTSAYQDLAIVAFTGSSLPVMGSPCVGLIASKSFLPCDERLATEYLGEKLILRSAPSRLIREMPDQLPRKGMLKRSNGCQGTEVFFLDEICGKDARVNLLTAAREWGHCAAILQEPVERSVLGATGIATFSSTAVEIRPIVYVYGWKAALVGEVVTGRAIPAGGERRGNVSRGAYLLPVLREASNAHKFPG